MLKLSNINFTYLFIQAVQPVNLPVNVALTLGIGHLPIIVPIPLNGVSKIDDSLSKIIDYVQIEARKTVQVQTSNVTSKLLQAQAIVSPKVTKTDIVGQKINDSNVVDNTTETQLINYADPSLTYVERGEETFTLSIVGGQGNALTPIIDTYMELASKTTWNWRFHYISNTSVALNLILRSYTPDYTELNPKLTWNFYKPETNIGASFKPMTVRSVTSVSVP